MSNFSKYLWKTKIDVSEFTGEDKHFIELREPNNEEGKHLLKAFLDASNGDDLAGFDAFDTFCNLCCTLIVDSDFYTEGETPAKLPSKDVAEFLKSKIELTRFVFTEYMQRLPLLKGNGKK